MRVDRFKTYLHDLLNNAQHPGIAGAGYYDVAGNEHSLQDIRVNGTDGVTVYLRIVTTAPQGGDDHAQPERIVEKSVPGVQVVRR